MTAPSIFSSNPLSSSLTAIELPDDKNLAEKQLEENLSAFENHVKKHLKPLSFIDSIFKSYKFYKNEIDSYLEVTLKPTFPNHYKIYKIYFKIGQEYIKPIKVGVNTLSSLTKWMIIKDARKHLEQMQKKEEETCSASETTTYKKVDHNFANQELHTQQHVRKAVIQLSRFLTLRFGANLFAEWRQLNRFMVQNSIKGVFRIFKSLGHFAENEQYLHTQKILLKRLQNSPGIFIQESRKQENLKKAEEWIENLQESQKQENLKKAEEWVESLLSSSLKEEEFLKELKPIHHLLEEITQETFQEKWKEDTTFRNATCKQIAIHKEARHKETLFISSKNAIQLLARLSLQINQETLVFKRQLYGMNIGLTIIQTVLYIPIFSSLTISRVIFIPLIKNLNLPYSNLINFAYPTLDITLSGLTMISMDFLFAQKQKPNTYSLEAYRIRLNLFLFGLYRFILTCLIKLEQMIQSFIRYLLKCKANECQSSQSFLIQTKTLINQKIVDFQEHLLQFKLDDFQEHLHICKEEKKKYLQIFSETITHNLERQDLIDLFNQFFGIDLTQDQDSTEQDFTQKVKQALQKFLTQEAEKQLKSYFNKYSINI
jgi:hypothetical protein